ncbi:MAG: hypothetical protein JST84_17200 [Acidobacteria bacterium]|nr:hypothetical protein [Acidobacteriota bacterium]
MTRKHDLWGKVLLGTVALVALTGSAYAQATAGGTVIRNQASASYTDDPSNPTKYSATSNEVTTTVSYVAGLQITPDGSTPATTVAPGSTATYTFTVTNLGNFTDNVEFLASGASIQVTGPGTVSQAFVDVNGNGNYDAGTDVDIQGNGAAATHSLAQSGAVAVVVKVTVSGAASAGQTIKVELGDTTGSSPYDNQSANNSTHEVHTKHPGSITAVNGEREAKGDITMTVSNVATVTNGPSGQPDAVGPGPSTNTDYTNKAVTAATTNTPVIFDNTFKNGGNGADTFKLKVATSGAPAGSKVEISIDGGTVWTEVITNGSPSGTPEVTTASVASGANSNYKVRITLPGGATALTAYETIIQAVSVSDPTQTNNTIDRIYTGYLRLVKTATVTNATGVGGATDAVPGADIEYVIAYDNIANAPTGTGNVDLDALLVVITEDGDVSPNNWSTTTDRVASTESDSRGGTITISNSTGGVANSKYVDTVGTLAGGQSGTFRFKRKIKQ